MRIRHACRSADIASGPTRDRNRQSAAVRSVNIGASLTALLANAQARCSGTIGGDRKYPVAARHEAPIDTNAKPIAGQAQ
jgi:hypothetical protein